MGKGEAESSAPGIAYVHPAAESMSSRLAKFVLRLTGRKRGLAGELQRNDFSGNDVADPPAFMAKLSVDTERFGGRAVFRIRAGGAEPSKRVLFLHGGAYVHNFARQHWQFAARLAAAGDVDLWMPDYPLAPASTHEAAFDMVAAVYGRLLGEQPDLQTVFMGDSAGGGLALAFAQKCLEEGTPQPTDIILICPWLDFSLQNPAIAKIAEGDIMLDAELLKKAAAPWAGGTPADDFRLSPINGPVDGLGRICLFTGTHDILYPDILKFRDRLKQRGIGHDYFEYPAMIHDWAIIPFIREARHAQKRILSILRKD